MNKNNKGFAPVALILIIAAVLVVGGTVYYVSKKSNFTAPSVSPIGEYKVAPAGKISIYDLKVGDKIGSFVVSAIPLRHNEANEFTVEYTGQAEVIGEAGIEEQGGAMCFWASAASAAVIPSVKEDGRSLTWFCFDNQEFARKQLSGVSGRGETITILISGYTENYRVRGNSSTLVDLVRP